MKWKRDGDKIISDGHEFDCCDVDIGLDDGRKLLGYNNWFMRDILPIWERLGVVERLKGNVHSYLEIGVNAGTSFFWILNHLVKLEGGHATGVDPYAPHCRDRVSIGLAIADQLFDSNAQVVGLKNYTMVREPSKDALMKMTLSNQATVKCDGVEHFDFVYVDGDHGAKNCLLDMMLAWDLMADGGWMIVDDFNRQFVNGVKQVRPAAMAFFDCFSHEIEPLFMTQRQIGLIKRAGRRASKVDRF